MWKNIVIYFFLTALLCVIIGTKVLGQYDSSYVESYKGMLLFRGVVSRKTAGINFSNKEEGYSLQYNPNKSVNVGVGVTYKFFSVSTSTSVYQPDENRGKTRDFDFQIHSYGRRFAKDFIVQFYKGFYLEDERYAPPNNRFYVRPDIAVSAVGGGLQYITNHRKFSYRASFQLTEWQKKSAGTFLIGAEVFAGRFRGDSTFVPRTLQHDLHTETITKMRFVELGPNVGFVYTWVYNRFFVTTGGALSLNVGINRYFDDAGNARVIGLSTNTTLRVSSGFNLKQWGINIMYLSTDLQLPKIETRSVVVKTSIVRMNVVYRLHPKSRVKKMLNPLDRFDRELDRIEESIGKD